MPLITVINGPNLNMLGSREPEIYGTTTLQEINEELVKKAVKLGLEVELFQSNHEGQIIDYIQKVANKAQGVIINPGALTHYGYSLRDTLTSLNIPVIEVHISNIQAREEWRSVSLISPVVSGVISGLGAAVYELALEAMAGLIREA